MKLTTIMLCYSLFKNFVSSHEGKLTLCQRSIINQKTLPNIIPSKIIHIWCMYLDSKIKFANCHWSWELSWIWHILRKSGDKTLVIIYNIAVFFDEVRTKPRKIGTRLVSHQMWMFIKYPNFLWKCQIQPN